ncbi:MAG: FKBP-type peptidyl-prolyl cis-trans isomerase [Planctomycetia bacterium]|nr:FKBP-type peptidyl-prolyl cis-trans isomerase [Planctomycetia bacterium]
MRFGDPMLVIVTGTLVVFAAAGCTGDADKGRSKDALLNTPHESAVLPPKKANLPDRPDGAGPIDEDAPDEFKATPSGLYYRILRKGGRHKPHSYDLVLAHYRGWLNNGTQFDSSYDRGEPTKFRLNEVVPGWTEGLQLIGEGGMIELEIPPRLGYGAHGKPPSVPPNSTLHFIVELQKIE